MVFLRNYLLITDLSLPVTILRNLQRVGILNNKQSVPIITNPTVKLSDQSVKRTVKRTLKKPKYDQQDEYLALLFLNSHPNENGNSPAQKLFNRQLRTNLRSVKPLLP